MCMKDIFSKANFMGKVFTSGKMEAFMRDSSLLEKDKEKEHGNHIMEMFSRVTIRMM